MTEGFYKSITGAFEAQPKQLPKQEPVEESRPINKDPEKWSEQANDYFKGHNVPKRVIETDGSQEVYDKRFVNFLKVFSILAVIALLVMAGIFVHKYQPASVNVDQPINIDNNITNQGDNINVDATDEINPSFYNDNQANIVIEKIEVTCMDGGCYGEGSGGNSSG